MSTVHRSFGLGLALIALPATAHHSPAMFDMSKEVVLEGTVTEVAWLNPHVYFGLEIAGPDGKPVVQQIEAASVSNLVVLGMSRDSLKRGDRLVVRAKPNREGRGRVALGWSLTKIDGTAIPLHVRAIEGTPEVTAQATSIAGTWVPQGTGFAAMASAAREWPLTENGRAAIAETQAARVAARSECVSFGPPAVMTLPVTTIVTADDSRVTFTLDTMNVERVVHLDRAGHPADLEPTLQGHSIGRWDGDTLVVDTRGYAAHPEGYAFDLPSSGAKHVVERFTLTPDRKHLEYVAVVEDPEFFAAPITHRSLWDYRPEQKPSGLPCEPDVAARFATGE
jgi:hypothetical protein